MMFNIYNLKDHPEVKRILAPFEYKKHKFILVVTDTVELSGTYWDGGSRSTYNAVNLRTLQVGPAPQYDPPQFGGPRNDPKVTLPVGVCIVKTGTFCGKTGTATVYLHPDNVAKLITQ
jgi:hypothetical protein